MFKRPDLTIPQNSVSRSLIILSVTQHIQRNAVHVSFDQTDYVQPFDHRDYVQPFDQTDYVQPFDHRDYAHFLVSLMRSTVTTVPQAYPCHSNTICRWSGDNARHTRQIFECWNGMTCPFPCDKNPLRTPSNLTRDSSFFRNNRLPCFPLRAVVFLLKSVCCLFVVCVGCKFSCL